MRFHSPHFRTPLAVALTSAFFAFLTTPIAAQSTPPTLALASSANPVFLSNPITLSATLTPGATPPTGAITFYDGAQSLGSVPLNPLGSALLVTSDLAVGPHTITATYAGDSAYNPATSPPLSQLVEDFTLSSPVMLDNNTCQCHLPIGTSIYLLSINPIGAATFPATISLTLTGVPASSTATIVPTTIAAGATTTPVTLTLQTPTSTSQLQRRTPPGILTTALILILLPATRRRTTRRLTLIFLAALTCGITGCTGTPSQSTSPTPQPYTINIIATSGNLQHSTAITLTIQ